MRSVGIVERIGMGKHPMIPLSNEERLKLFNAKWELAATEMNYVRPVGPTPFERKN